MRGKDVGVPQPSRTPGVADETSAGHEYFGGKVGEPAIEVFLPIVFAISRVGDHGCGAVRGDIAEYFPAIANSELRFNLRGGPRKSAVLATYRVLRR